MNDNFTPTVTVTLAVYQNMERRLNKLEAESIVLGDLAQENNYLNESVNALNHTISLQANQLAELKADNERLCRIVDGLQVQHRNDQGLD